jgi:hypothetical protein
LHRSSDILEHTLPCCPTQGRLITASGPRGDGLLKGETEHSMPTSTLIKKRTRGTHSAAPIPEQGEHNVAQHYHSEIYTPHCQNRTTGRSVNIGIYRAPSSVRVWPDTRARHLLVYSHQCPFRLPTDVSREPAAQGHGRPVSHRSWREPDKGASGGVCLLQTADAPSRSRFRPRRGPSCAC